MDLSKTGKLIVDIRKEKGLTQRNIADRLGISPKTVSKWERGQGFPDVSLISDLCRIFQIDVTTFLDGKLPDAKKESGNLKNTKFFVCKKCGNVITSIGDADINCCGRKLTVQIPAKPDSEHTPDIGIIEDEFYITFSHPMTKQHYISFVSYVKYDRVLTLRLYPEQGGEVRLPRIYGGKMYYCCSQHGLFEMKI